MQRITASNDIADFSDPTWTEVNANGIWTPVKVQTNMEQCATKNLINIWQMFNVATDAITAKPYIQQKVYFNEFVANVL